MLTLYSLSDNRSEKVCYVGLTKSIPKRMAAHKNSDRFRKIWKRISLQVLGQFRNRRRGCYAETLLQIKYKLDGQCKYNTCPSFTMQHQKNLVAKKVWSGHYRRKEESRSEYLLRLRNPIKIEPCDAFWIEQFKRLLNGRKP